MTDLLLNFDMVVFEEVEDSDMDDWEDYEPYKPSNARVIVKTEKTDYFPGENLYMEAQDTFKLFR